MFKTNRSLATYLFDLFFTHGVTFNSTPNSLKSAYARLFTFIPNQHSSNICPILPLFLATHNLPVVSISPKGIFMASFDFFNSSSFVL